VAEHETTIPADLFGDALLSGWVGPVQCRFKVDGSAWEWSDAVWPCIDKAAQWLTRLDLTRAEARHRLCVVLTAGERCDHRCEQWPQCANMSGHEWTVCSRCGAYTDKGEIGHLRKSAPAWHLLPVGEGGALPAEYAHHAPALLARHARRVAAGMGGIVGINALRPPMPEVSIAAGYALIDSDGTLRLPELPHA
jgi:hypothetical protein